MIEIKKVVKVLRGTVLKVGDGIAEVSGLIGVKTREMVEFPEAKLKGIALNLNTTSVEIGIFYNNITDYKFFKKKKFFFKKYGKI